MQKSKWIIFKIPKGKLTLCFIPEILCGISGQGGYPGRDLAKNRFRYCHLHLSWVKGCWRTGNHTICRQISSNLREAEILLSTQGCQDCPLLAIFHLGMANLQNKNKWILEIVSGPSCILYTGLETGTTGFSLLISHSGSGVFLTPESSLCCDMRVMSTDHTMSAVLSVMCVIRWNQPICLAPSAQGQFSLL